MKTKLLLSVFSFLMVSLVFAQKNDIFKAVTINEVTSVNKNVARESFPIDFKLYQIDIAALKAQLFTAEDRFKPNANSVLITLPNAEGGSNTFKVYEASNFDALLQSRFPNIRAYVGNDIKDKRNILRLSFGEMGIQTMTLRPNGQTEYLESYSTDNTIYAAFKSATMRKGKSPFTCTTADIIKTEVTSKGSGNTLRNGGNKLRTFNLAQSCTGEYANYFGATSSAQEGTVISAFNATYTRVNGVYETDFAYHLSLISAPSVIFYDASTDPYSPGTQLANWNNELEATLQANVGDEAFDVGHLFGASGGGGNAGCIGCVCEPSIKGRGITSPGSGGPVGDRFDIDYVAHELGHQFGGNHTYSHINEGSGVNMEPGSGSTIMAYAGITNQDVQPVSDPYFHVASIVQIETNITPKTCPKDTIIPNVAPVTNAGLDFTIPKSTPFMLTGSATDTAGEGLTYTWEQYNTASAAQTAAASAASATKATGPNWRSYSPVTEPTRTFPRINSVVANSATTIGTEIVVEALSSVARTLTFVLTARDNYLGSGLTNSDLMVATVNATAGPFLVSAPTATGVSWVPGSVQTVTWDVAGTTTNGVNCPNVDIFMSSDGGFTYPTLLASNVPNDGSETISVPNTPSNQNRIMVKGNKHIFFDISNNNFTIAAAASTFRLAYNGGLNNQTKELCNNSSTSYVLKYETVAGFTGATTFSATGNPAGTTVTFSPTSLTASGDVTVTVTSTNATAGNYTIAVTGTSGATTKAVNLYLVVKSDFVTQTLSTPANNTNPTATSVQLTWVANAGANTYDYEVSTNVEFTQIILSGNTVNTSLNLVNLTTAVDYYWRIKPKNTNCAGTFSAPFKFRTGGTNCGTPVTNNTVVNIADGTGANTPPVTYSQKTITIPASVTGMVNKVETTVSITHTYLQDLIVELVSPDGTIVPLISRKCDNSSINGGGSDPANTNYVITFSDAYTPLANGPCVVNAGGTTTLNAGPTSPLNAFVGKTAAGAWTLRARDWYNGDTGSLRNWSLTVCNAVLGSESFEIADLKIFPNPNNGTFTVNFNAETENTSILAHDIRGRQIFENKYTNNGAFNQTIDLNNAESGIYLVTITDGNRKTTKKVVVE